MSSFISLSVQLWFVASLQYFIALEIFDCDVWTRVFFKVVPICICIGIARRETFLAAGLFMSLLGDVAMELADQSKAMFLSGVAAFLFAHVLYVVALLRKIIVTRRTSTDVERYQTPLMNFGGAVAYTSLVIVMSAILLGSGSKLPPNDTVLRVAIVVYAMVISAFGFTAFRCALEAGCFAKNGIYDGVLRYISGFHAYTASEKVAYAAFVGSLLFICSDSLLALNRFHSKIPNGKRLVMLTYYAAQMMIAKSSRE
jgi:uncharacterized membrane protein YhhN